MPTIKEYKTVTAHTSEELDQAVNDMLEENFEPYGSQHYIGPEEGRVAAVFCQPMIRKGQTKSETQAQRKALEEAPPFAVSG